MGTSPSSLVTDYLDELRQASGLAPVLDLACGAGRNGLELVRQGIPVVFADIRRDALDEVKDVLPADSSAELWEVDLEAPEDNPLENRRFGAILVFRYLHRPLMDGINEAIVPGGLVIYETFTAEQPRYGRPTNPDFLLRPDELPGYFPGWEVLLYFEGTVTNPDSGHEQAIARLVARKPAG